MPIEEYGITQDALYKMGVKRGFEVGLLYNVVVKCLELKYDYEEIAIITELSISEIEDIDKNKEAINRKSI